MSDEKRQAESTGPLPFTGPLPYRARKPLPDHPVRVALLDLLAEAGTLTSTEAATRLGHSSGLCSFHLRQLAAHGLIEEAPHKGGRVRPWRLRWEPSGEQQDRGRGAEFDALARGLEDESHQHWLSHRDRAPAGWRQDESFSAVVHLTPAETAELAASVSDLLAAYRDREDHPGARPAGAEAVAVVTRLFPLLADNPGRPQSA